MFSAVERLAALALTQEAPAAPGFGEGLGGFMPIVLMIGIFYFVLLRPAQKERAQHKSMLDALKRGDEIVTSGGIVGTITDMQEGFLTIEIAKNVRIKILRSSVAKRYGAEKSSDAPKKEEPASQS